MKLAKVKNKAKTRQSPVAILTLLQTSMKRLHKESLSLDFDQPRRTLSQLQAWSPTRTKGLALAMMSGRSRRSPRRSSNRDLLTKSNMKFNSSSSSSRKRKFKNSKSESNDISLGTGRRSPKNARQNDRGSLRKSRSELMMPIGESLVRLVSQTG